MLHFQHKVSSYYSHGSEKSQVNKKQLFHFMVAVNQLKAKCPRNENQAEPGEIIRYILDSRFAEKCCYRFLADIKKHGNTE